MSTVLNTQPIFTADVSNGFAYINNVVSVPRPGAAALTLVFEGGELGALLESLQIHYLNWGATEPANDMFFYCQRRNSADATERYCIMQTVIAANAATALLPAPITVTMPDILFGTSKRALRLAPGERLFAALRIASTAGFNIIARGGQYG